MRKFAFLAPLAAAALAAGVAHALPASQPVLGAPQITVTIGGDLTDQVEKLGQRDVDMQIDELTRTVERALARDGALAGAQVNLVLIDLKPNRPTIQQAIDRPGLSIIDSVSIGGAAIEGEIITADGERLPVKYERYSTSIADVWGYGTWQDADRAYDGLARNLVSGRLMTR